MDKSKIAERVVAQLANEKSAGVKEDYDISLTTDRMGIADLGITLSLTLKAQDIIPSQLSRSVQFAHNILLKAVREVIKGTHFEISDDYWSTRHPDLSGECVVYVSELEMKKNLIIIEKELHKKLRPLTR